MNGRKLSVALAALLLGLQVGSPAVAQVTEEELSLIEFYVDGGQVEDLLGLLQANPELLELPGALGDALRAFFRAPSLATLELVAAVADGRAVIETPVETQGTTIY